MPPMRMSNTKSQMIIMYCWWAKQAEEVSKQRSHEGRRAYGAENGAVLPGRAAETHATDDNHHDSGKHRRCNPRGIMQRAEQCRGITGGECRVQVVNIRVAHIRAH